MGALLGAAEGMERVVAFANGEWQVVWEDMEMLEVDVVDAHVEVVGGLDGVGREADELDQLLLVHDGVPEG